jgi:hypothetical protein
VSRDRESLRAAVLDIDFELHQLVDVARQAEPPTGTLEVASLESALLHVRNLLAFFDGGEPNWITVKDYLPRWSPPKSVAMRRLRGMRDLLNAHLSHLSWERVTNRANMADNPEWSVHGLADDVLMVFTAFVERLQAVDSEAAEWYEPALIYAWVTLREEWPGILPRPPKDRPLLVRAPVVRRA